MANNYIIDFTDPLSGSFQITDSGFNGPGGKASSTTLRLYGRGAPQWGESVNENFVKMLENFMGASEPLYPRPGQMWVKTYLYYLNDDTDQFYVYNISTGLWSTITVISATTAPPFPASGQYWYDQTNSVLNKYFQSYKQQTAAWHSRKYQKGVGSPQGNYGAHHELMMFDATVKAWAPAPVATHTSSASAPINNRGGTLRYDPAIGKMLFWDSLEQNWITFGTTGANPEIFTNLNMNGYKILNLSAPAAAGDAVNYGTTEARYVKKAGDTVTGHLTQNAGNPTAPLHLTTKAYVDATAAAAAGAAIASLVTIPTGLICLWSGALNNLPSGWVLCDGTQGTPNLRDRFVIGAGLNYAVGATGGSKDAVAVSHDHAISGNTTEAGWHAHGVIDPGHTHIAYSLQDNGTRRVDGLDVASLLYDYNVHTATSASGTGISLTGDGIHSHTINGTVTASGESGTGKNMPPYYALAYIMKT